MQHGAVCPRLHALVMHKYAMLNAWSLLDDGPADVADSWPVSD
jgi:hypothetical protein